MVLIWKVCSVKRYEDVYDVLPKFWFIIELLASRTFTGWLDRIPGTDSRLPHNITTDFENKTSLKPARNHDNGRHHLKQEPPATLHLSIANLPFRLLPSNIEFKKRTLFPISI